MGVARFGGIFSVWVEAHGRYAAFLYAALNYVNTFNLAAFVCLLLFGFYRLERLKRLILVPFHVRARIILNIKNILPKI